MGARRHGRCRCVRRRGAGAGRRADPDLGPRHRDAEQGRDASHPQGVRITRTRRSTSRTTSIRRSCSPSTCGSRRTATTTAASGRPARRRRCASAPRSARRSRSWATATPSRTPTDVYAPEGDVSTAARTGAYLYVVLQRPARVREPLPIEITKLNGDPKWGYKRAREDPAQPADRCGDTATRRRGAWNNRAGRRDRHDPLPARSQVALPRRDPLQHEPDRRVQRDGSPAEAR